MQSRFKKMARCNAFYRALRGLLVALIALTITGETTFAGPAGRSEQATQETKPADVRELKVGAPIERELGGGEAHSYNVSLVEGQYLKVAVEQKGSDVVVRLFGPERQKLTEVDNLSMPGVESIFTVAGASGAYRVEVQSSIKEAKVGKYEIKTEELREATSKDRIRLTAQKVFEEAKQLRDLQTAESRQKAIKKYEEALLLWRNGEDRIEEANTLSQIGSIYRDLSDNPKALEYFGQALLLYQAAASRQHEAITLDAIGLVHWQSGEMQKALEYLDRALPLSRTVGDRKTEAATLNDLGNVYIRLDKQQQALEYFEQALSLKRQLGDRLEEAETLVNIGASYQALGDQQKMLEYNDRALPLLRLIGNREGEAAVLNNNGYAYFKLGELQKALECYGQSVSILRLIGHRSGEGYVLDNMGQAYRVLGDSQKALQCYEQALEIRRAIADRPGQATTHHNIGMVYMTMGELERSLQYFEQALLLQPEVGDRRDQATTLDMIGKVYLSLGEPRKALDYHSQSLSIRRAVGDRYGEAKALANIGGAYYELGELEKALDYGEQSLKLTRIVGDRTQEAATLHTIGSTYSKLRQTDKAIEYYTQSLTLSRAVGFQSQEATTLLSIARLEGDRGNLPEARRQLEAALNIIESTRAKVASPSLRSTYLAAKQDYYTFYVDLLMQMHRGQPSSGYDAAALQVSERARARSLLEILTESRVDIRQNVDPELLKRERSLQQQLNTKSEGLTKLLGGKHTKEQETAARKEVDGILTSYQDVEAQIRARSPRYAELTQPQPLSLKEIQQVLDDDTLLLEYKLGEQRSYLWAVTPTAITSFELPKRSEIEAITRQVYEALTARNKTVKFEQQEKTQARIAQADTQYVKDSALLSEIVLGPVAKQLAGKRLLIVSDGALQYVPFGALPAPHAQRNRSERSQLAPLVVNHEIVSLPSASVLALLRRESADRQRGAKTLAVVADPVFQVDDQRVQERHVKNQATESSNNGSAVRGLESELLQSARDIGELEFRRLPHSRQEAEWIAASTPKNMRREWLDFDANRAMATGADLSNYRIIHFATHGFLNSQHPELSGIVLSLVDEEGKPQDGFLRLHEIYNLKLGADLVVLSACRTALGKEIKGEGLVGLTRGFMYAGAPRVVASLWAVDDETTAELMKRLYDAMLIKRQRPAAALRAAQAGIWKDKRLPPYYWAAFVLQGEWQ